MTYTHGMKALIAPAFIALALHATAASAQAPGIPAKAGEAAGTVTAGGKSATLKYAYAAHVPDDGAYQVILTDQPVPPEALADELKPRGGARMLRAGKVSGVSMLVDPSGNTRNVIPFVGDTRGSQSQGGGSLAKFAVAPAGVTGQGHKDPGGAWSYSASFNAALRKP
jgi:hypothetical protein